VSRAKKAQSLGFGFDPQMSEHYFLVSLPNSLTKKAKVEISEHFHWHAPEKGKVIAVSFNDEDAQTKVFLPRSSWDEIADEVKAEFNRRLRAQGIKVGKWLKRGQIPVDRRLGKELVLLAWAIEEADPVLIPTAVRNWLGLAPEERWWLYMMTNASTGHAINGSNKGWRKAVRFALTENPISEGALKKRHGDFELQLLMPMQR